MREHRFLAATGNIGYDWDPSDVWFVTGQADDRETHYPMGPFGDIFGAQGAPGLLLLHAPGNVFVRDLARARPCWCSRARCCTGTCPCGCRCTWSTRGAWAAFCAARGATAASGSGSGPGRVAVQSVYERPEDTEVIVNHSYATTHHW